MALKIKLKKVGNDDWKVRIKDKNGNDVDADPVQPGEEPSDWENTTTVEVEVRRENPRWVKIGGRWYYIG